MAECRRCQAEISDADIQKGRALQRGEFYYCPSCVAEARAAKGGGSAAPAPASKVAAGAAKSAPSATRSAPGALKPAPASSAKLKPAPAPAAAAPASKKDKFADLMDEEGAAEEPAAAPGKPAARGPASSRLTKAAPPPASSRMRRAPEPPPEEESANSGAVRRKIGFKDASAPMGQPMSKQSFMIWALGGGAMFLIAIVMFSTLIVGKMKADKKLKEQGELAKANEAVLDRTYREDRRNVQAIDEAFKQFEESAKGTKYAPNLEEWTKKIGTLKSDIKKITEAKNELSLISGALAQPGGGEASRKRLIKATKSVTGVGWLESEKREFDSTLLGILNAAKGYAEKGKGTEPKNWDEIAGYYLVVDFLGKYIPPDVYPASEAQLVRRDIDEAVEKRYEDPAFLDRLQWQDVTGSEWKSDAEVSVSRTPDGISLSYSGAERAGLFWLNQVVSWQDYQVQVEFTTDKGFQVLQRTQPGQPAGATHDFGALVEGEFIKPNERVTATLWVYMGRFRTQIGESKGRPAICPPSAPRSGGISIRVPKESKVTIHKISVKIMSSEEAEADTKPAK